VEESLVVVSFENSTLILIGGGQIRLTKQKLTALKK
jgi:hypothetical protein